MHMITFNISYLETEGQHYLKQMQNRATKEIATLSDVIVRDNFERTSFK